MDVTTKQLHHCGVVVHASPNSGDLWLTADGGQPDRTSEFMLGHMGWARQYGPPPSREGAYVVPRLFRTDGQGTALLRNVYIFPCVPPAGGDQVKGWADITHPNVPFSKEAYDGTGTEADFKAMKALLPDVLERVRKDREECLAIQNPQAQQPNPGSG